MLKTIQIGLCIFFIGFFLFCYLDRQNKVTEYQLKIPKVQKEIERLSQENQNLKAKINHFEHPSQLMSLLKQKDFSHLDYYHDHDVVCMQQGKELIKQEKVETICRRTPSVSIATGVSY